MRFNTFNLILGISSFLSPQLLRANEPEKAAQAAPHWSYEGAEGPQHWSQLNKEWSLCESGKEQSPVDLKWKKPEASREIKFHYQASALRMIDNGHTLQVNFDKGSTVDIAGESYDLLQMHFHTPSEHALSKKTFPLEAHFVHADKNGHLAVIGVFLKEGKENAFIKTLWANAPKTKNEEKLEKKTQIDPQDLIPELKTHYHYAGSLTTPPCTEGVNWNVLNTPIEISAEQLEAFHKFYAHNARPLQKLNVRKPASF